MGMLNKELRWAMNKAIFLDRDGTINVDKHYVYKAEDFEFLPYAIEGLNTGRRLSVVGFDKSIRYCQRILYGKRIEKVK